MVSEPLKRAITLSPAERLARTADPCLLFGDADERPPHRHQVAALQNWRRDHMLLWTRQGGKSTTGAVIACHNLLFPINGTVPTIVVVSRAERQSGELFRKSRSLFGRLPYAPPVTQRSAFDMAWLRPRSVVVAGLYDSHLFWQDFGGARPDRTADLLHAMQALSQLSYSPTEAGTIRSVRRPVKTRASCSELVQFIGLRQPAPRSV